MTGEQIVVPPSLHSSGEELAWSDEGEPARPTVKPISTRKEQRPQQ